MNHHLFNNAERAPSSADAEAGEAVEWSRRRFLGVAGGAAAIGAAGVGVGSGIFGRSAGDARTEPRSTGPDLGAAVPATAARQLSETVLVTVQLDGGIDSLNTVVPMGRRHGRYRDLRNGGAIDESNLDRLDDDHGLFAMPYLASQWEAGRLGVVHGVGWEGSSLSHFDAAMSWEKGSPDVTTRTGWMYRTLEALGGNVDDPLIGMSIDSLTPAMYGPDWSAATVPVDGSMPWVTDEEWERSLRNGVANIARNRRDDPPLVAAVRRGQQLVFDVAETVGPMLDAREYEEPQQTMVGGGRTRYFDGEDYVDSGWVGRQLRLVADMVNTGVGTRAFHVAQGGYDTHSDQQYSLPRLQLELDHAVREFFERLGPNSPNVVLATWSEFGRRPEWNGSGTDHGTAATHFVVGDMVRGGHHGEPSSLDSFDHDDNFVPTTDFRDYIGSLVNGVYDIDDGNIVAAPTRNLEVIR